MAAALKKLVVGLLLLPVPSLASSDECDEAIAMLKRRYDAPAIEKLRSGPPSVDSKLLTYFDELGRGRGMLPNQQLQTLMSVLADRRTRGAATNGQMGPPEALVIVLRLQGRNPVYAGSYFYDRGPEFYNLLLELAKGDDAALAKSALSHLRDTAMSRRNDDRPGDPALIRLFRRESDWHMLGILRDRASIPAMRRAIKSADRRTVVLAMSGLSLIPDLDAVPLIVSHLADPEELAAGKEEGKFGTAYWALRRGVLTRYVPLLVKFAEEHEGIARAYAINLIGYFGSEKNIRFLERYANDALPRTREAVSNAVLRLQGKLPDPHDRFGWKKR